MKYTEIENVVGAPFMAPDHAPDRHTGAINRAPTWGGVAGCAFIVFWCLCMTAPAHAATKIFSGAATDATVWHDDDNWFSKGVPGLTDATVIDLSSASVKASKEFKAKSVTVGGKATSTFTTANFVYGTLTPDSTSDPAILIRKNGTVVLTGEGTITAKGPYKNSEETLPTEPSVMVVLT